MIVSLFQKHHYAKQHETQKSMILTADESFGEIENDRKESRFLRQKKNSVELKKTTVAAKKMA